MICRLRGTVREQTDTFLVLDVHGVFYQVFIPPSIMQKLSGRCSTPDGELELVTYHYQQLEVGKGFSVLIGFTNDIEREFFERFITVSGVGPKAALRALTMPIPTIAHAIDEGNVSLLKTLPGIGEQRAKEIVAKLQGKVGKFALIQPTLGETASVPTDAQQGIEEEAITILLQLEYKKHEAKQMVKAALVRNPKLKTAEELLNEVYRQRASGAPADGEPERRQERPVPVKALTE